MTLSIIKHNEPKRFHPPDDAAMAELRERVHGADGPVRVGKMLDEGQPVCIGGDWILPETMVIDDGNSLRRSAPGELRFETGVDETTANPVAFVKAYIGERLVHSSSQVELRKGVTLKDPVAQVILTKRGLMLTSELRREDTPTGGLKYWQRLTDEQAQDPERLALGPDHIEIKTTPTGVETWELVHSSAIPRGSPQ